MLEGKQKVLKLIWAIDSELRWKKFEFSFCTVPNMDFFILTTIIKVSNSFIGPEGKPGRKE